MSRKFSSLRTVAVVAAALTLLAACGQGNGNTNSAGADIPVGALNPLTGSGAVYGPGMLDGIKIAVDEVNAAGGALDKKLKLYTADDQSDPNAAVRAAQKLVNVNKVYAILGTYSSAVTLAVAPIAIRNKVLIMNTSGAPQVSQLGPLAFQFNPRESLYGHAMAELAHEQNFKKAAILAMNNPAGQGMADAFGKDFTTMGGQVTVRVNYQENQTSYKAELNKVLATNPDVVQVPAYTPDAAVIIKEGRAMDPSVRWIGPAFAFNQTLIKTLGPELTDGLLGVDSVPARGSAAYEDFAKKYKVANGNDAFGNVYAAMTYDMVNVLALAIQKAGSTNVDAVTKALHEISGNGGTKVSNFAEGAKALKDGAQIDYQGASGPLNFNETNNRGVNFGVFQLKSGTPELLRVIDATNV